MQRKLVLEFTKMNGAGNDFIVIDNRFYYFSDDELSDLARRLCPRRTGVGADGLLAFGPAQDERFHFRMTYMNADGSRATMCGNGARCLARFARWAGIEAEDLRFESDAGPYRAHVPADPAAPVRLYVPDPQRFRPAFELQQPDAQAAHFIWTGTEHLVCFVPDAAAAEVARVGPALRHDPAVQPTGANVNFVQVLAPNGTARGQLQVRTFEKGVEAETLACGTGALAAGIVAHLTGHVPQQEIDIHMPGGTLTVGFERQGDAVTNVYLEGPTETIYRGTLEV